MGYHFLNLCFLPISFASVIITVTLVPKSMPHILSFCYGTYCYKVTDFCISYVLWQYAANNKHKASVASQK